MAPLSKLSKYCDNDIKGKVFIYLNACKLKRHGKKYLLVPKLVISTKTMTFSELLSHKNTARFSFTLFFKIYCIIPRKILLSAGG
jgi:hypothetical protein